jgi:cell division protease FtsH
VALTRRLIEVESIDADELRRIIDESTEGPLVVPGTYASTVRPVPVEPGEVVESAGAE